MEPWHCDDRATIYHGDCIEVLQQLPDCSVDAVVTDPPYGLEFMGKEWDRFDQENAWRRRVKDESDDPEKDWGVFNRTSARAPHLFVAGTGFQRWCELWAAEALRVLKPGGHLLAFGGTRTWHRLAVAIEDAGFEIRDSIAWMYGSGFPKSLDVSKAIDKQRGEPEWQPHAEVAAWLVEQMQARGVSRADVSDHFQAANIAQQWTTHWITGAVKPRVPKWDQWQELKRWLTLPDDMDALVWQLNGRKGQPGQAWQERPVTGRHNQSTPQQAWMQNYSDHVALPPKERRDNPATPDAARWQGWGTALKPAHEPVVVARKPLTGTVAANVLEHGTGALNIDGCRIGTDTRTFDSKGIRPGSGNYVGDAWQPDREAVTVSGRWPANVVLDEDQADALDQQSGISPAKATRIGRKGGCADNGSLTGYGSPDDLGVWPGDKGGGASRFFYVAKAPARERPKVDGIAHPTVKPLTLMRWLCRLVTPPGGVVLEPFAGSGTTIEAALLEGFRVVAIEREPDYLPLIAARLERIGQEPDDGQLTLDASA